MNAEARYMLNENWAVLGMRHPWPPLWATRRIRRWFSDKNQPEISVGIVRHLNFKF